MSGARPVIDTSAIDGDQRELDGNETGIGGHERKGGKQPERGVDRSSRMGRGGRFDDCTVECEWGRVSVAVATMFASSLSAIDEKQPVGAHEYERPRVGVHPDRSRSWIRRIWPVVAVRRRGLFQAVAAGLVATAASIAVPVGLGRGVNAVANGNSVAPAALFLAVLATVRLSFGFLYRFRLFQSAHLIESDLRNLIYERLTELSFPYWDRVQSGQIISRANSDVRSIQLLLAFGPLVAMQLVLLALGLVVMITMSLPLTLVAVAPLPLVFMAGIALRERIFPLSWVTQARTADLATIVDENIQGPEWSRPSLRKSIRSGCWLDQLVA